MVRRAPVLLALVALAAALTRPTPATAATAPNDPLYPRQWNLDKIGAPTAWAVGTGQGVTIAVVDSGVDLDHEDLVAQLDLGAARDWVDGDNVPEDENGHGTHVSGIAAAATNNRKGVAGVAPAARVMPLRVLDKDGEGSTDDVEAAIDWAVDHGARVVNLSLSEPGAVRSVFGSSIAAAVNRAWAKGVICVIAAGNDFLSLLPSGYGGVNALVVSATTRDDTKPDFSSGVSGAQWGIAAPGGGDTVGSEEDDVASTYKDNSYAYARGTSMSAPHVAGAASVLLALGLSPQQTVDRLLDTADDIGAPGRDRTFGAGRLNLARAVAGLGTGSPPPTLAGSAGAGGGLPLGGGQSAGSGPATGGASTGGTGTGGTGQPAPSGSGGGEPGAAAGTGGDGEEGDPGEPGAAAAGTGRDEIVTIRPGPSDGDGDGLDALPVALALGAVALTGTVVNLVVRRRQRAVAH